MSGVILLGVGFVVLALLSYSVAILSEQRRGWISRPTFLWLVQGVAFDVGATVCMAVGSGRLTTPHGLVGYPALALMLVAVTAARRHRSRAGDGPVPRWLHLYLRVAYVWWVVAFVTGALLARAARA